MFTGLPKTQDVEPQNVDNSFLSVSAGLAATRSVGSPMSATSFLNVIRSSGLIPEDQLDRLIDELTAEKPEELAQEFIRRGLLTPWQCDKLLQGRHKGFVLGKYRLLSLLGKGGMSAVYLAEHMLMRRQCAIKVLPTKRVHDSSYLGRFHREAQAVAALDHPNIVRAYDVDHETDGANEIHFLVMEYVQGRSLHEVVQQDGVLDFQTAANYARQAAVGLEYAHGAGLIHRDIKPGNLLLDQKGTIKILDLGLALFSAEDEDHSLTVAHDERVLGTADYLAPEQAIDSHKVDARADIYSLGCTLYFVLTGSPPFPDGSLTQRLMAHQTKMPPPLSEKRPDIPTGLAATVVKMMAKRPDDRYQSAAEAAAALEKWITGSSQEASASPGANNGRRTDSPRRPSGTDSSRRLSGTGQSPSSLKSTGASQGPRSTKSHQSAASANRTHPASSGEKAGPGSGAMRSVKATARPPAVPFPTGPVESEFASFELLDTAPPMHGPGGVRSSVVRNRKKKPAVPGAVWAAIAAAIVIVLIFVIVLVIVRGGERADARSSQVPADQVHTDNQAPAISGRGPELIGREIVVGPDGDFQTINAALDYVKEHYPVGRTETQVITVTGGRSYQEAIQIDNRDFSFFARIRIASSSDEPATLDPPGNGPVIQLVSTDHVELDGFRLDGEGRKVVVSLGNEMKNVKLRNLTISSLSGTGVLGNSVAGWAGDQLLIENVTVESVSPESVAFKFATASDSTRPSRFVTMKGLRLVGPMSDGILIADAADNLTIRNSIFYKTDSGIHFVGGRRWKNIAIGNNTFYKNNAGILFDQLPDPTSDLFAFRRNIFIDSTRADALVATGFDEDRFGQLLTSEGDPLANNMTTRPETSPNNIDLFGRAEAYSADFQFVSSEPGQDGFLVPTASSPGNSQAGTGQPQFVGALPPR